MKISFYACLACCVSASALAADLPSSRRAPAYVPPPPPIFSWTGLYVGANAGYAFDGGTSYAFGGTGPGAVAAIVTGDRPAYASTHANGFTGGGQIGYNYQIGHQLLAGLGPASRGSGLVLGIEADAAYSDLNGVGSYLAASTTYQSRTDFIGTVRGRVGLAFGNVLVFGTGGFAYGDVRENLNYYAANGVNTFTGSSSSIRTGYAYGGGVEYAIPTTSVFNVFHSSAVTLKAEYLHYDLGTSTLSANSIFGLPGHFVAAVHNDGNLVRGGINYKFDSAAIAPVVARY